MPSFSRQTSPMQTNKSTQSEHEPRVEIQLLGDSGVGISALISRFVDGTYNDENPTRRIGVAVKTKIIEIDQKIIVKMMVCEGKVSQRRLSRPGHTISFEGTHAIFVAFDTTKLQTFNELQKWLDVIKKNTKNMPIILVGTKADLEEERQVDEKTIQRFITYWNGLNEPNKILYYTEVSAKNDLGVNELFENTARNVVTSSLGIVLEDLPQRACPKRELIEKLDRYIAKIEGHRNASGIDFSYGFFVLKDSRAINRKANYLLASGLKQALVSGQEINRVFADVQARRATIINDNELNQMADFVERGINSSDLNEILTQASRF